MEVKENLSDNLKSLVSRIVLAAGLVHDPSPLKKWVGLKNTIQQPAEKPIEDKTNVNKKESPQ